jgi:hypothetical protein
VRIVSCFWVVVMTWAGIRLSGSAWPTPHPRPGG